MLHKILIISPTPTHPTNAGNRARIFVYSKYLISQGHEVHFLYSDQEDSNIEAMQKYWGPRFHHIPYKAPQRKNYNKLLLWLNSNYKYYCHIDDYYNELLDEQIKTLHKRHAFTIVFIEYIFLTKALDNFDDSVLKIVDTHDVMADRHKHFLNAGKEPVWYSTSRKEEKKGINRADVIMAIQEKEAKYYRSLTKKRVITAGHIVEISEYKLPDYLRQRILFIGSNNPNNFHAIVDFIKYYLPPIIKCFPGFELLIAGKICDVVDYTPGIIKIGELDDIAQAYRLSDIVLNPLTIGTGLKIKMIEALGQGKIVISTTIGAEGLESGSNKAFLISDDPDSFVSYLVKLFSDKKYIQQILEEAYKFTINYNFSQMNNISDLIQNHNL